MRSITRPHCLRGIGRGPMDCDPGSRTVDVLLSTGDMLASSRRISHVVLCDKCKDDVRLDDVRS